MHCPAPLPPLLLPCDVLCARASIRYICREIWPSRTQEYYYTLSLFALQFVVPLGVLVFTYTRIAIRVWGKRPPGEAETTRDQRMARSKRKVSPFKFKSLSISGPPQKLIWVSVDPSISQIACESGRG